MSPTDCAKNWRWSYRAGIEAAVATTAHIIDACHLAQLLHGDIEESKLNIAVHWSFVVDSFQVMCSLECRLIAWGSRYAIGTELKYCLYLQVARDTLQTALFAGCRQIWPEKCLSVL